MNKAGVCYKKTEIKNVLYIRTQTTAHSGRHCVASDLATLWIITRDLTIHSTHRAIYFRLLGAWYNFSYNILYLSYLNIECSFKFEVGTNYAKWCFTFSSKMIYCIYCFKVFISVTMVWQLPLNKDFVFLCIDSCVKIPD